jgi:hypothetical protein
VKVTEAALYRAMVTGYHSVPVTVITFYESAKGLVVYIDSFGVTGSNMIAGQLIAEIVKTKGSHSVLYLFYQPVIGKVTAGSPT